MHWLLYFNLINCVFHAEAIIGEKLRLASAYEYPFVVSIGWKNPKKPAESNHFCMGVVISKKNVLTCTHCLEDLVPKKVQVTVGSGDLSISKSYDVASWTTFDEWNDSKGQSLPHNQNEIAVMHLSKPIYNAKIKPVKLSTSSVRQIDGEKASICGFGVTNNGTRSRFLMVGNVTVLSRDTCNERFKNESFEIVGTDFCSAADPYLLGGHGDSGGPILNADKELLGIHLGLCPKSRLKCPQDEENFKKYQTNLHLSVDFYREFIRDFR